MKKILIATILFLALCGSAFGTDFYTGVFGQSNAHYGWSANSYGGGGDTGTPDSHCSFSVDGTNWTATPYTAAISFCNTLHTAMPTTNIKVLMFGEDSSALNSASVCQTMCNGYWLNTNSTWWPSYQTAVNNAGGVLDANVFMQGETEGVWGDKGNYTTDLESFFTQIRTGTGANTKIIISGLNAYIDWTSWLAIRADQSAACTADGSAKYVDMSDLGVGAIHYSATDNITVGTRLATALVNELPVPPLQGCKITGGQVK